MLLESYSPVAVKDAIKFSSQSDNYWWRNKLLSPPHPKYDTPDLNVSLELFRF